MKANKCLYCYKPIEHGDYHPACSKKFFGSTTPPEIPFSIGDMTEMAKKVVESRISVPGVQPKISMSILKENIKTRLTVVGMPDGSYIFKPPSDIYPEMPANEHLTMRIAEAYGIRVVPSNLVRLKSGELAYITKRIDRSIKGSKKHMLDMFQITEAFDKYKGSMEKIGKAIHEWSNNTQLDKLRFFELTLFCFLSGNSDMHLKNFSLIESLSGWELSPAYDLLNVAIANPDDKEEFALTLNGKKKKLIKSNFLHLGDSLQLTEIQIERAFMRMIQNKPKAIDLIKRSFLSEEMRKAYLEVMESRYLVVS